MLKRLGVGVFGVSLIIACGGGGGSLPSGGQGGSSTPPANAQAFLNDYCDILTVCCRQKNLPADGTQCKKFFSAFVGQVQPSFDSAKAGRCLDGLRGASTNALFCDDTGKAVDAIPECDNLSNEAPGTKQPGETCNDSDECAKPADGEVTCHSKTVVQGGSTTTVKTCRVEVMGKEGDTCNGTKDDRLTSYIGSSSSDPNAVESRIVICEVANGTYCDSSTRTCTKVQGVDGPCKASQGCSKDTYCNGTKCVARTPAGGDCATNSTTCLSTDYCDDATKKCLAGIDDNQPCEKSSTCKSKACVQKKCSATGSSSLNTWNLLCGSQP